jgi:hypothetical protein
MAKLMKPVSVVTLSLTQDQALVLFEWLSREDDRNGILTEHPAEQTVLWAIQGQLEKALIEPLRPGYGDAVSAARERIVSVEGKGD